MSVVDVLQQLCELQLALCIPDGRELSELFERLHIPVTNLQSTFFTDQPYYRQICTGNFTSVKAVGGKG